MSVIVADHDPDIAVRTARAVAGRYSVVAVVNQLEALQRGLDEHEPDVMILGLMWQDVSVLPRLGGLLQGHPLLRICMYTNQSAPRFVADALRAGATGYVIKPAVVPEIYEAIESVLAGRRYLAAEVRHIPGVAESVVSGVAPIVPPMKLERGTREWDRRIAWLQYDLGASYREAEIMVLARQGLTKSEAAVVLACSEHTVASHCDDLYRKFKGHGVRNGASLAALTSDSLARRPRDWVRQGKAS